MWLVVPILSVKVGNSIIISGFPVKRFEVLECSWYRSIPISNPWQHGWRINKRTMDQERTSGARDDGNHSEMEGGWKPEQTWERQVGRYRDAVRWWAKKDRLSKKRVFKERVFKERKRGREQICQPESWAENRCGCREEIELFWINKTVSGGVGGVLKGWMSSSD